jgi:hypothetical protein
MKLTSKTVVIGFCAAALAAACSTGTQHQVSGSTSNGNGGQVGTPGSSDNVGAVGLALTLPGGEHLSSISYTLKNANNTYTGTYNVSTAGVISFVIGSVAADTGYSLSITGTSDDGKVSCSYPAAGDALTSNISVANRTTTVVNVNMQCVNNQGLDSGSVLVNAVQSNCPVWNTIVVNPENITLDGGNVNDSGAPGTAIAFNPSAAITASINMGQSAVVVGSGTGPNQGALTFAWSVNGTGATIAPAAGVLDPNGTGQPNGQSATNQTVFSCPPVGTAQATFTISLDMTDGPVPEGGACDAQFTHGTVQVTCVNPAPCGGAPLAPAGTGVGLQVCTVTPGGAAAPPLVSGGVSYPYATTATTDQGNVCCAPICNGTGPVATPANGTGTCTGGLVNNGQGCCVPLQPCTTVGQANCVKCGLNDKTTGSLANGVCTSTEAKFVQHDINKGKATGAGADPAGSCYACLAANTCLDDTHFNDQNHECGDPAMTTGTTAQCGAVLDCILASSCSGTATSVCYCGTADLLTTCQGNPANAVNGSCDAQIAAGLGFTTLDGTDNTAHFTDGDKAAGIADQIFNCAVNAGCTACLN